MPSHPNTDTAPIESPPVDTTPLYDGRFVPFRRLGIGSQGETFEAVDRLTGKAVALKRFDIHGAESWKDVELAEREARVLQTLSHPALPAYIHHFEHAGALYLAMEKIDGTSLAAALLQGQRFSFDELLRLLETLADVFHYLHGRQPPIVHRDIKPSNLLRRENGQYALIDFGSVRDGLRPQGGSTVVGTFGYMAPEQFQGRALPASDLYGTGATLLTLLTGITPDNQPHRGLELDVRKALPANTPKAWVELLERLTSVDPDKRAVNLDTLLPALRTYSSPPNRNGATEPHAAPTSHLNESTPEWFANSSFSLPFPVLVLLQLLRVVLYVALQVALPLLLTLLSVIFGRSLRGSAKDISNAGELANRQISRLLEQASRSRRWDYPRPPFDERRQNRRTRVGSFDVDLPDDSPPANDSTHVHGRKHE